LKIARQKPFGLAVAIGFVGGALFAALNLPLAWMLGAMVATTLAALSGVRLAMPQPVRQLFVTVLGVMLGSAFTPEIASRLGSWLGGIGLLCLYMPLATWACYLWFRRVGKFDPVTAYFAATPGGVGEMTLVGEAMGGDARRIALVHSVRILVVVFTVPIFFRLTAAEFHPPTLTGAGGLGLDLAPGDVLALVGCAALGWPLARLLRLPAAQLVGPMLLSAAAHLSGLTAAPPPFAIVALAQVMVGAAIGSRFSGLSLGAVGRTIALAAGSSLAMLALTALLTAAAVRWLDAMALPAAAIALALAPGGLAEMALVALALGIETAFVSTMHIVRIALVVTFAPLFFRMALRRPPAA